MIPSNVGSVMGVGCNGEVSRNIIGSQHNGAGSITQYAGDHADVRRTDTNEVDCITKGEAVHYAVEMCGIIELQRSCSTLKRDRPKRDRRSKLKQCPAIDRKRAKTCGSCDRRGKVEGSGLNLHD